MEQSQINLFEDLNNEELIAIEGGNWGAVRLLIRLVEIAGVIDFINEAGKGIAEGYKDGKKDFK